MTDWVTLTLEDAGVKLLDCDHKTPAAHETGRPYVGIPEMTTGRVVFETARKISEEDYVHWTRKTKYQTNDVILSRRTNPGVSAIDDTGTDFALGQNLVLLRADGTRVLPEFLRWLVHTAEWWEQIDKYLNVGAVFSSLKCRDVPKFELTIPPMTEQEKINSTLRPIADKIELNRQMNETLEDMARALFRDWFVDFGPTRRQMEGATDPTAIMGHAFPPETAVTLAPMFSSKLGNDDLPVGWYKRPVGELSDIVGGGTPNTKTEEFWEGGTHLWATPRDLSKLSGCYIKDTERKLTDAGLAKVSSGLSPKGSVLMSSRAPIGYLAIASEPIATNQGFIVLRPTDAFPTHFAKLWCEANMETVEANANGSTFPEISKKNFKPILATVPSAEVMEVFSETVGLLFGKIAVNEQENQTLAAMRDLLLPKLMSGEIRLRDAGVQIEEQHKAADTVFVPNLFGEPTLSPERESERDAVIVAGVVAALQRYDLVVGNVRVMKGNYLVKRKLQLSTAAFEKEAAGPYDRTLNRDVRGVAKERGWILETSRRTASGQRITGNVPGKKYTETTPLVEQYGLSDALAWLQKHFRNEDRYSLECLATVDCAQQALRSQGRPLTIGNIKADIASDPAWEPKLSKPHFSDLRIKRAMKKLDEVL